MSTFITERCESHGEWYRLADRKIMCPYCFMAIDYEDRIAALTAERDALRADREIAFVQHRNAYADRVRWHAEFRKAEAECARLRGLVEKVYRFGARDGLGPQSSTFTIDVLWHASDAKRALDQKGETT